MGVPTGHSRLPLGSDILPTSLWVGVLGDWDHHDARATASHAVADLPVGGGAGLYPVREKPPSEKDGIPDVRHERRHVGGGFIPLLGRKWSGNPSDGPP